MRIPMMKLTNCGNLCDICQAYRGNYEKHDERPALAAAWKKYVGLDLAPEKIRCPGGPCCAVSLGFRHDDCSYKPCASRHGVEHCGFCPEFPCEQFGRGHKMSEKDMREKLGKAFSLEEYEKFVKVFDNRTWVENFQRLELSKRISICGFRCDLCQAYAPNIRKKDQRAEVSRVWKKYYGFDIAAEKIQCDGCRAAKRGAKRLDTDCPVRPCVLEKGIGHCGDCQSYPCAAFGERRGLSEAQARKKLGPAFDAKEFREFIEAYDNVTRLDKYLKLRPGGKA